MQAPQPTDTDGAGTMKYQYDYFTTLGAEFGKMKRATEASGTYESYTYDELGRVKTSSHTKNGQCGFWLYTWTGISLMNNPNDVKGAFRDGGNTALMGFGMGFTFAGIQEYFNDQKKYINPWTGKPSPVDSPEGYVVSPSKKGNGTLYKDPNNPHNNMRVMPGNSNSPNAAQQNPYVIYKINGVPYDVNGLPLPGANIPDAIFHLMNLI